MTTLCERWKSIYYNFENYDYDNKEELSNLFDEVSQYFIIPVLGTIEWRSEYIEKSLVNVEDIYKKYHHGEKISYTDENEISKNLEEMINSFGEIQGLDLYKEINKKDSIAYVQGQEMLKAGKLSRSDLQQLKAAVSESGYAVVNSITQVRNYKLQLKQLLELQPGEEFDITPISTDERLVTSTIPDKMDVYSTALASRPEIISGKYNIESSELQLKIAKAGYMPTVSLTGGIGDNHMTGTNENFGNQMKYNLSGSVGLTLSIPIFDNRQTKSAIEKAKYNYANAQLDLTDKEKDLYSAIETYWLNATSNQQRFIAAKSNVESQQENNDLISEQFRLGLKDIVELTTSRSSLLQAKQEMLESKYMTLLNVQLLKFYSGEEIKL